MKIEIEETEAPPATIEEFADRHGLVMQLRGYDGRWTASFKRCEVRTGTAMLLSAYGVGKTKDDAIRDYAKQISCRLLIYDATGQGRKEVPVPELPM